MTKKTATTAPEIERPTEEPAALALREAVSAFNSDALTRSALSAEDQTALGALEPLAAAYASAAEAGWENTQFEWRSGTVPLAVSALPVAVTNYAAMNSATETRTLTSGEIETPAIESPSVRAMIAKTGAQLIASIDAAIEAGYARVRKTQQHDAALGQRVEYWMGRPVVRALVAAFSALRNEPVLQPLIQPPTNVLEALRVAMLTLSHNTEGGPDPLVVTMGRWREWIGKAEEILTRPPEAPQRAAA